MHSLTITVTETEDDFNVHAKASGHPVDLATYIALVMQSDPEICFTLQTAVQIYEEQLENSPVEVKVTKIK